MTYISNLQRSPADVVLVHNHVRTHTRIGSSGFRAWLQEPEPELLEVCELRPGAGGRTTLPRLGDAKAPPPARRSRVFGGRERHGPSSNAGRGERLSGNRPKPVGFRTAEALETTRLQIANGVHERRVPKRGR
jgi:hypothetical protein